MYKKIGLGIFKVAKPILLVTIFNLSLQSVSVAQPQGFKTPSGNIFCELISGEINSLRCEVGTSLKPKPPEPYRGYCEFDWGRGLLLPGDAKPEVLCISDTIADPNKSVLGYGKTWNQGGFQCISQTTGLTCKNNNGYGFFLSREKWRVLGLRKP